MKCMESHLLDENTRGSIGGFTDLPHPNNDQYYIKIINIGMLLRRRSLCVSRVVEAAFTRGGLSLHHQGKAMVIFRG